MHKKIVVFGAGATGRGHVGLLAWQVGFEIVFVDKDPDLVARLQQAGRYKVRLYGEDCQEIEVSGFRVYPARDRQAIAEEIAGAALVLTAVFDQNLPDVAQTLALAAATCQARGRRTPLNFIACENMMDSSSTLGRHVRGQLRGDALAYAGQYFGFPDCMISRIVPRPEPDPLVIVAEDYNEWTARAEAFKGEKPPELTALELVDNQAARLERKLFIHNGGHAVCGYVGFHRRHRYIHEAVADPTVAAHVMGALHELGEVVRRKHGFSVESIAEYKADLARRGTVAAIRDEILRVVRDPIRKLSSRERLVAPALLAVEYGLPRGWIVRGIVAALRYRHPDDPQSLALAEKLARQGLEPTLQEVCQIAPGSPLALEIAEAWRAWDLP
ncbi:MAG: mannitol-1-phosphate 5-dehydrogenase [Anaerolineae bacterium]